MGGGGGPKRFVTTMQYVRTTERHGDVRRSRHALGRGRAQPRHHGHEVRRLSRRSDVPRRHRLDSELRADGHVDEGGLPRRRRQRPLRADDADDRRRGVDDHRRRRHPELAGDDLPGEVDRRLQAHARAVLRERELHALRRRALRRRVPSLQGRPCADRRLRERRRGPPDRRPRLRVPRLEGQARLVPESVRGDRHDHRLLRRRGEPEVSRFCRRDNPASRRRPGSTPSGRTSIWRRTATSCR